MDLNFNIENTKGDASDLEESESSNCSAETWPYFPFLSLHPENGKKNKSQLGKRRSKLQPLKFDCSLEIEPGLETFDLEEKCKVEEVIQEVIDQKIEKSMKESAICKFNVFSTPQDSFLDKENVSNTLARKIPDEQKLKKEYLFKNEYPIRLNPFQPKKPYPLKDESNIFRVTDGNNFRAGKEAENEFFKPSLFPSECLVNRFGTVDSTASSKSESIKKTAVTSHKNNQVHKKDIDDINFNHLKITENFTEEKKCVSPEKQNLINMQCSDVSSLKNLSSKTEEQSSVPVTTVSDPHVVNLQPKQEEAPIVLKSASSASYNVPFLGFSFPVQKSSQCSELNSGEHPEFGINARPNCALPQFQRVEVAKNFVSDTVKNSESLKPEIFKQPALPVSLLDDPNSRPVLPVLKSRLSKPKPASSTTLQSSIKNQIHHSVSEKPSNVSVNNSIQVNNKSYRVLSSLGHGGSSEVYQVLDPSTSKLLAIKCVDLSSVDKNIAEGYLNEVALLERLQGCSSVICMFDHQFVREKKQLFVVMEKGDTDLAKLIKEISKRKKMSMSMIVYYWTEMLIAVEEIHAKGIIHSDLKPANFLLVSGRLKLIDFGIASSIQGDMTSVLKEVTTGTWNYMSPEALKNGAGSGAGFKISFKSDVWSLGCILYNLVYGKTPFSHINNTWGKIMAIADSNHAIPFPEIQMPPVLCLALKSCLQRDPKQRPSVKELINLPYHSTFLPNEVVSKIKQILPPNWFAAVAHLLPEEVKNNRSEKSNTEIK